PAADRALRRTVPGGGRSRRRTVPGGGPCAAADRALRRTVRCGGPCAAADRARWRTVPGGNRMAAPVYSRQVRSPRFTTARRGAQPLRVALFATCLVDQLFPDVGVATVRLLRHLGVEVT